MSDGRKCEFAHFDFGSLPMVNSARVDSEDTDTLEERERDSANLVEERSLMTRHHDAAGTISHALRCVACAL